MERQADNVRLRRRRWIAVGLAACAAAAVIPGGAAPLGTLALPQQSGAVDLLTQANVRLSGGAAGDRAGQTVALVGDVNGDGLGDVAVGASGADKNGRMASGSVYVVYGRATPGNIDLEALGSGGFRIDGAGAGDYAGSALAGGDVNGDQLADVIVGAPGAGKPGQADAGAAYVVYGSRSAADVDLAELGSGFFRITGAAAFDMAGIGVAAAGDMTGDGRSEVLIGALGADNNGRMNSGSVYVVFGAPSSGGFDLSLIGAYGFQIDGAAAGNKVGSPVAGAGDVNGDGRADIVIGAPIAASNAKVDSGSVYVVYGAVPAANVDLAVPGPGFFRIDGAAAGDRAGEWVDGVGDITGDGRSEVIAGASGADNNGRVDSGSAYVVYGASSSGGFDLSLIGAYGFRIDGGAAGDWAGSSVGGVGDVNGDGRRDVVVGSFSADNHGRVDSGSAWVVFGRPSNEAGPVDLAALGPLGFRVDGAAAGDFAGAVAGLGDENGDGRPDVILGTYGADSNGADSGAAFVVYGFGAPELAYDPVAAAVGEPLSPVAPSVLRRTGPASFGVSPALPAGLTLDAETGVLAGTAQAEQPATDYTVTMTDLAGSTTATLTIRVDAAPAADTTPPQLVLGGPASQRLLVKKAITVRASCDEPCSLTATGSVVILGTRFVVGLKRATAELDEAGSVSLRLVFSPAAQSRLRRHWDAGERVRAKLTVRAVDEAGNASTSKRTVTVRR